MHDPTVKAELLALSYRLGYRSHIYDLLALLEQNEDYEQVTDLIEVLLDLTDPQLRGISHKKTRMPSSERCKELNFFILLFLPI